MTTEEIKDKLDHLENRIKYLLREGVYTSLQKEKYGQLNKEYDELLNELLERRAQD